MGYANNIQHSLNPPAFVSVSQVDAGGNFNAVLAMSSQGDDAVPYSSSGGNDYYLSRLYLNDDAIPGSDTLVLSSASTYEMDFAYSSIVPAYLSVAIVGGNGESVRSMYGATISYAPSDCAVFARRCHSLTIRECIIDGDSVGIDVGESNILVSDCEIILRNGATAYIVSDYDTNVTEFCVNEHQATG